LEDCRRISAAAEAEAKRNNWNVCIAILDDGGHLLHLARMDGASPANARIAVEKGRTAAESRRSSAVWEERIKAGRNSMLGMPGTCRQCAAAPSVGRSAGEDAERHTLRHADLARARADRHRRGGRRVQEARLEVECGRG